MLKTIALPTMAAIAAIATPALAAPCDTIPAGHNCYIVTLTGTGPYSTNIGNNPITPGTDDYYFLLPTAMNGTVAGATMTVDFLTTTITNVLLNSTPLTITQTALGYSASGTVSPRDGYQRFSIAYTLPTNANTLSGYTQGSYSGVLSFVASPAPEAATWSMMIAGFGLVGGALRSRKVKAAIA